MKLFVKNIDRDINEVALESLFAMHGKVVNTKIVYDKITWESKGFGFVEMLKKEEGEKAIAALNGFVVKGRPLIVVEADEQKEDSKITDMLTIRPATESDQQAIMDIYNESVLNNTATFDTEARTLEKQMEWFRNHKKNHPVLVGEKNGMIIGWASLSPWSDRCAYDTTVEVSVYVHKDYRKQGIGSQLLKQVTILGQPLGNHTVLSRITQGNEQSIHIHEKLGYRHVGTMKEVGFKFDKFLDVHMMQLVYS